MTDTVFNPEVFEAMAVEGANQTAFIPVPEGDYEGAYIAEYEWKTISINNIDRVTLEVYWVIPNEELAKELNVEELKVRQTIWLDLTEDGGLDFGTNKNIGLGRLREGLNMNKAGVPFEWSTLRGSSATISVTQRADKHDPSKVYNDISRITQP